MRVAGDSDPIEPCLFLLLRDLMDHGIYQHLVAVILGGRGMGRGGGLLTRGGVARPGYTLPAQLSVPGIATIASVATTMARVAADTDLGHVHLSCYYANQHTHKLQLTRALLNSDSS